MSPEQQALAEATSATTIANLVVLMTGPERRHVAAGLIALAQVLIDGDELGAAVLSSIMRAAASDLDLRRVDLRLVN